MSALIDNSLQYKAEIKNNFESLAPKTNGIIEAQKLNEFINSINPKKKNQFIYNTIKSLTYIKNKENEEGISSEEYISFIDNQLNDDKSNQGLKNIFNVFCDENTGKISWSTFPLIAQELGDIEMATKLLNIIKQSRMYTKELNFKEFSVIMNNNDFENGKSYSKNNEMSENSENSEMNNMNNLNINEYIEDYEEIPTYKQRKMLKKQNKENESDITVSSKNSIQENDEVIVEEKYYNNTKKDDNNEDNDKSNKRYHRRYRSKKVKNNNNFENIENGNDNHKSYNKYRKKHLNI